MTKDEMWDKLEELGVSEQTLQIVTDINGYSEETLYEVLYAYTGYRNFNQMKDDPAYADIVADIDDIEACGSITASTYNRHTPDSKYLYIFKHGIGPGTMPSDAHIVKVKDLPNYYTAVWLDRFLTTDEMKQYDIPFETDINYYLDRIGYCQKDGDVVPCDDVEACDQITASDDFDDDEDKIYWVQAYYGTPRRGMATDFATNDWDEAIDKLVEYANQGYHVVFENLASGEGYAYDADEILEAVDFGDIYTLRKLESLYEG